jgi:hypothetical protein
MAIHDVEQQTVLAFLQASAACMEQPDDSENHLCSDLCELATAWEIIYVRELMRPLLPSAG